VLPSHFFRENNSRRTRLRFCFYYSTLASNGKRGKQTPHTNSRRAEIAYLVNFQKRKNLTRVFQYLLNFIRSNRVQPAPERIQLNHLEIAARARPKRRRVQPRMIRPLVAYAKRPLYLAKMRHRIFTQNGNSVRRNKLGNPVVNLGVYMIRPPRQNNRNQTVPLNIFNCLVAHQPHILAVTRLLVQRLSQRGFNLARGNFAKLFHHSFHKTLLVPDIKKRILKTNPKLVNFLHIIFNILGIRRNNRAIIRLVCAANRLLLKRHARIKNIPHTFFNQRHNMPVRQFCRITLRLARNRLNPQLIQLARRTRRKLHPIF
jgi:hypothetical protein